jgi:valyl-tRNA synthetase
MTQATLPPQYNPFETESLWQKHWEEKDFYTVDVNGPGEPYCIMIPPPNVTGSLHIGHALTKTLQDVLIRYHRMRGYKALWLPGTDHAGIATQTVVERELGREALGYTKEYGELAEQQKKKASLAGAERRKAMSREEFFARVWQWKEKYGGEIVNQLKRLGCSCDWSRERFTMDEGLSKAVLEAFVRMYEKGLIYRGEYMVNWCPASISAVSDLEVENKEVDGSLWYFRYPIEGEPDRYLVVATTRPETMLGDTAVAVNPKDARYKDLIGKMILLPIQNRAIPIIGDEILVDPEVGTGCVKVTPAHDPNDFATGKRHNLPLINILNIDGTINENGGPFAGQDRFEARKNVVAWFEEHELLEKVEPYRHSVPFSQRGGVPIEPLLSTQWFAKMQPLAQSALAALENQDQPHFVPERWTKVYRDWLENIQDWCISRQLWWGHQIPAWYLVKDGITQRGKDDPLVVARTEEEAYAKAREQFGQEVKLARDEDVLDTWFSSGLWPFSTLGWPEETPDFKTFYPTSVLVTGFDIIFFWVARMTMMAHEFTGEIPFRDVYINGLVLDEKGQKMSKSKGNGIDPLELMSRYGTDALRFTLVSQVAGAGQDIRMDYKRSTGESPSVEASRNFANKVWNASRFVLTNLEGQTPAELGLPKPQNLELADRWILNRYAELVQETNQAFPKYELGSAAKSIYAFLWDDYCDWYIELVKPRLRGDDPLAKKTAQQVLAYVLEGTLKLLHPWMPHLTEGIWQVLTNNNQESSISVQPYPTPFSQVHPDFRPDEIEALGSEFERDASNASEQLVWNMVLASDVKKRFGLVQGVIRCIRGLRNDAAIEPVIKVDVILLSEAPQKQLLEEVQDYIRNLARVETLTITEALEQPVTQAFPGMVEMVQVLLPLTGVVDINALKESIQKQLEKLRKEEQGLKGRLDNKSYVERAPKEIVQKSQEELAELKVQIETLESRLKNLST